MDDGEAKDLITDLPDAILHSILSLIPTKFVFTTSSVSKRWREISSDHLVYANTLDFGEEFAKQQTPDQFADNVNKIIEINKSEKIFKFKLIFSPRNDQHKANAISWIKFAISRDVEEIDLDFCRHIHIHFLSRAHVVGQKEVFELPDCLFNFNSLITIKLRRCILNLPEVYTGLSRLQTLCLKEVHIIDSMLESLLSNCRLLEVLVLKECGSLNSIRILAPTRLKRLTVYECSNASILDIYGSNIRSLLISAGHLDDCKLKDMSRLEEVFIGTRGDEFGGVLYIFMKVLPDLSHVRALTLYLGHLVPSLIKDFQVKFNNLQEFHLINSPRIGLFNSDVHCIFRHFSSPSLRTISIELSTLSEEKDSVWEYRKANVTPVERIFKNLKTVTLRNFRGTSSDIELAAYFLLRSPVLELMHLMAPQSSNAKKSPVRDDEGSSSTSMTNEGTKVMENVVRKMLGKFPEASAIVEIKTCESVDNLLSFFKWHHVSDVYCK